MKKIEFEKNLFKTIAQEKEIIYVIKVTIFIEEETKKIKIAEVELKEKKEKETTLIFETIYPNLNLNEINLYVLTTKITQKIEDTINEITMNRTATTNLIKRINEILFEEFKKIFGGG